MCRRVIPKYQPASPACKAAVTNIKRTLTLKKRARTAMAANKGTHQASLARQQRQNDAVGFHRLIPWEADHSSEALTRDITKSTGNSAVSIRDVVISPPNTPGRALPEQTSTAFIWKPSDLLAERQVVFFVESLTKRRFVDWYNSLPKHLDRMLLIDRINSLPGGHKVVGRVFTFRNVSPPTHTIAPTTLETHWNSATADIAKCTMPDDKKIELQAIVDEIESGREAAQDTLNTLAVVRLEGERFKQFERLAGEKRTSLVEVARPLNRYEALLVHALYAEVLSFNNAERLAA